jgi:hypothetical protein
MKKAYQEKKRRSGSGLVSTLYPKKHGRPTEQLKKLATTDSYRSIKKRKVHALVGSYLQLPLHHPDGLIMCVWLLEVHLIPLVPVARGNYMYLDLW